MSTTTRSTVTLCAFTLILLLSAAMSAQAAVITFTTRAAFDAAAPGLPVETFESGLVGSGSVTTCTGPLTSAVASACFPVNTLLPGVTYSSQSESMAVIGDHFVTLGNPSKALGPNVFSDTLDMTFASASAAGFDLFLGPVSGNAEISIFSPTNQLLASTLFAVPTGGAFFGVLSDAAIGRINIAGQSPALGEFVDNVAFGTPGVSTVPEPSTLCLLTIGLIGGAVMRRR